MFEGHKFIMNLKCLGLESDVYCLKNTKIGHNLFFAELVLAFQSGKTESNTQDQDMLASSQNPQSMLNNRFKSNVLKTCKSDNW